MSPRGLTIDLLGPPEIQVAGIPLEVDTRKAIAILAHVAMSDRAVRRDSIATLFWPEHDTEHARGALRRTLSVLRKALGGEFLLVDRGAVRLDRRAARVDVERFRALVASAEVHEHGSGDACRVCAAALTEAVELHRGDFMAGFTLRDSEPFDDWQAVETEHLRRELAGTLERLGRLEAAAGRYDAALEHARRRLALDPLHEPAQRDLMLLHCWAGDRSAALLQYRAAVRVLEVELGVAPLAETTDLYQAILEDRVPTPASVAAEIPEVPTAIESPAAIDPTTPPIVGRDRERARIIAAYDASARERRLVIVEGEAGIGKTRLAAEVIDHAREAGGAVLAARCHEGGAMLAYGLVGELLRLALAGDRGGDRLADLPATWLAEIGRLLPEIAERRPRLPAPGPLDSPGAHLRLLEAISQVLQTATVGDAPGLIVLDDAQWADAASLEAILYLVRRSEAEALCIVLAWRPEEIARDHPVRLVAREFERDGRAAVIPLHRLSGGEVRALLSETGVLRREDPATLDSVAERLFQESEGLPFFVVEYLAAQDRLDPDLEGSWPIPAGVKELVRARLDRIGDPASQVVAAAAVIGRSFTFETVRDTSGRSDEETVEALEDLVAAGIVQESPGDRLDEARFDFRHEKIREVAYGSISLARRRLLHGRVASVLERGDRRRGAQVRPWALIADHRRLAGMTDLAAEAFRRAGDDARRLYANPEALADYEMALGLDHPDGAALHESIADLKTLRGDYGGAARSYEAAAALSPPARIAEIEYKLGVVQLRRGAREAADAHFLAAQAATTDRALAARILADRGLAAHRAGDDVEARRLAEAALEMGSTTGDATVQALAHNVLGILATHGGDPGLARAHLEQSLALATAAGDLGLRVAALNNLALANAIGGNRGQAIEQAESALRLCATQGDRHREAAVHNNLADLLHADGRGEEAMEHLKAAVAIFAEVGEPGILEPGIWRLVDW
jgi:DNA-binding SARP family transcriptional activator/predicted ATPase